MYYPYFYQIMNLCIHNLQANLSFVLLYIQNTEIVFLKQHIIIYNALCKQHLRLSPVFWWGPCCSLFLVFCVVLLCVLTLWFPHKYDVRFVFTSSCLSCLIYVICVCLRILVSNTDCVVFCFSSSCVLYVASFSGLSIFDCPFGIL